MNTLIKFLSAIFSAPLNFANENNPIPMEGNQFDFQKMVLTLLGLGDDAKPEEISERFKLAMDPGLANSEAVKDVVRLNGELEAANAKITASELANSELKKELEETKTNLAANALNAVNDRVIKAEALAANARQSLRKFVLTAMVKEGRITKHQFDEEDKRLSGPEFANAEQFDARVAELAKRESAFGITNGTSIFAMLNQLGEMANNKAATSSASSEFLNMVNAEMATSGKSYEAAWTAIGKTEKGKGLLASMKQPAS